MSIEAMRWAFAQDLRPSSMKFVLVSLGDNARDDGLAWPSLTTLCKKTGQDRKTVIAALDKLEQAGYLVDSGERIGATRQVKVYRFNFGRSNNTENGTVPKTEQFLNSQETVPFFPEKSTEIPGNSTVFPHNSTENGTRKHQEPSITPKEPKKKQAQSAVRDAALVDIELPDWLPRDAWKNWIVYRRELKAPLSEHAAKITISKLADLRAKGNDPVKVIDNSIMSGKWTGLFALPKDSQSAGQAGYESPKDRARRETIESLTGSRPHGNDGTIIDIN